MKHRGQFKSGNKHPRAVNLKERLVEIREMDLGSLRVPTGEKIRRENRSRQMLKLECAFCGEIRDFHVDNILSRKTKTCRCMKESKYEDLDPEAVRILGGRYDAALQRCNDLTNMRYGGRGIRVLVSRHDYIEHLALKYTASKIAAGDVDRIDNSGHYEIGNLRIVSRAENARNKG
ncbi:hypothetical protein K4L02_00860 [Phaeobacter inhibens]|uniref:hypothetical protein n=1 Tax=Phaeobacter inhibens TaxID=221822 RepID=UPI0021A49DC8|nr:hypothetical protein [Phaeobacter inhibens]UWR64822.1 hypothetical protein K4L02_00860 [Phaeobacter inhibens]